MILLFVLLALQVAIVTLAAYNLVVAIWGWSNRVPAGAGRRDRRFRVVVPAHNEADVILSLLGDIEAQDYDGSYDVWVIADRCTDDTAARSSDLAKVAVRTAGTAGKGAALAWFLAQHPLGADEALVILDADNRVPPNLLARFADELDSGHQVLQAYLDVSNPDDSALATASALTYWAGNRMAQLARTNLGWSADLGGTGMCISAESLAAAGGFNESLTEDQDLTTRFVLAGNKVVWLHDLRIGDEKPTSVAAALQQRARWMAGKRSIARARTLDLLRAAIRQRSLGPADLALRLVQPGRSFVALVSGVFLVVSAAVGGELLLPWQVWATAVAVQLVVPVAFLMREGVPMRYVVRYPLVALIAALWAPARILSQRVRIWRRTEHHGTG